MQTDLSFLDFIERIMKGDLGPVKGYCSGLALHDTRLLLNVDESVDLHDLRTVIEIINSFCVTHPFFISFHKTLWKVNLEEHSLLLDFLPALLEESSNRYLYWSKLTELDGNYLLFLLAEKEKVLLEIEKRFVKAQNENDFRFFINKIQVKLWGYLKLIHGVLSQLRVSLPPPSAIVSPLKDENIEFIRHKYYVYSQLNRVITQLTFENSKTYSQYVDKRYNSVVDVSQQLLNLYGDNYTDFKEFSPDYLLRYYPLYVGVDMTIFDEVQTQMTEVLANINSAVPSSSTRQSVLKIAEGVVALENIKFQALFARESGDIDSDESYTTELLDRWYAVFLDKHNQDLQKAIVEHQLINYLNDLQLLLKRYISTEYSDEFIQNVHPSLMRKALMLVNQQIVAYQLRPELFFPKSNIKSIGFLKWKKDKVAFVEMVAALHLTNSVVRKDGTELSMEGLFENLKEVFDVEISDFYKTLHDARNRKLSNTVFLDELKKAFTENADPNDRFNAKRKPNKT